MTITVGMMPLLLLCLGLLAIIVADIHSSSPLRSYRIAISTAAAACLASLAAAVQPVVPSWEPLYRVLALDPMGHVFSALVLGLALLAMGVSQNSFKEEQQSSGEYYTMLLSATLGGVLVTHAQELLLFFIAFELLSIPLYIAVSFRRYHRASAEAGLKYFLSGAVSAAFFLFGASWIFGATGSTLYSSFPLALTQGHVQPMFLGILMVLAAFGFKLAAAPFHMWAPDTYQGAPIPVAAFLSTVPKAAMFGALARLLLASSDLFDFELIVALAALSVLSVILGNLVAITQQEITRLLAYSGVAQVGYLLMGVCALGSGWSSKQLDLTQEALGALLFYLLVYTVTNMALWVVILLVSELRQSSNLDAFNGLSKSSPLLAFALLIGTLSLAGVPPLAGFVGKVYLFRVAFYSQPVLAVIGVLGSVLSLYYYFNLLRRCYFLEPETQDEGIELAWSYKGLLVLLLTLSAFGGLIPTVAQGGLNFAERILQSI